MTLVEQELPTLPENMSLPRFYYGVLVDFQFFVYFLVFCRSLFDAFSSDYSFFIFKLLTIVLSPSLYSFWLPLWYLQVVDHCVVCPSLYGFWLLLFYLQVVDHCVVSPSLYSFWLPLWNSDSHQFKTVIVINLKQW